MIIKVISSKTKSATFVDTDDIKLWGYNYCTNDTCEDAIHYGVEVPGSEPFDIDYISLLQVMKVKLGDIQLDDIDYEVPLPQKKGKVSLAGGSVS